MKYKTNLTEKVLLSMADLIDSTGNAVSFKKAMAAEYTPSMHPFHNLVEGWWDNKNKRKKLYKTISNLLRSGYIQRKISKKSTGFIITPKGEKKLLKINLKELKKTKLPNDQWLMVFFDIPEKEKTRRELFRRTLKYLGFAPLQKSIWVTRYSLLDELKKIIKIQNLQKYAKLLIVKEINQ